MQILLLSITIIVSFIFLSKKSSELLKGLFTIAWISILTKIAYENLNFFLSSEDFKQLLNLISTQSPLFNNKISYTILQFVAIYFDPIIILLILWSSGLLINIYCCLFILKILSTIFYLDYILKAIIGIIFSIMVLLYSSEGIFGYFGFGPDNYIATAHLLLQGLSCSLLLLAFVPYNNKMMKKYLFIILAIMIHPSSLIYWGLSLQLNSKKYLSKISTNKKRVYLRCYQKIKIYMSLIIISYMIVLFYKIYLELLGFDGMNFDEKAFGVESPLMIIKSFLLILTTSILFKLGKYFMFKNKATTRSRDVKGEELIEFILNLFMNISIVSITMIPFSLGLSYRISYFIYISTPLCMIIISISIIYIIRQYSYIFLKNLERL